MISFIPIWSAIKQNKAMATWKAIFNNHDEKRKGKRKKGALLLAPEA